LIRGFPKSHLSSFASSAGFLLAYYVGGPVSTALMGSDFGGYWLTERYASLLPSSSPFTDALSSDYATRTSQLSSGLTSLSFPKFFQGIFINRVMDVSSDVAHGLASSFSYFTILIGSYLILYLLTFFLIRLIFAPLWSGLAFGENGKSLLGRLAGVIYSSAKGVFFLFAIALVVSLIDNLMLKAGNSSFHSLLVEQLSLDDPSRYSLGRLFYNSADALWQWINLI
jgi:hypothetical protein